jgi:hypothetical protein
VLRIGTIEQVEVFTEIGFARMAVKALMTRCRVRSDDAHPGSEPFYSRTNLRHHAGELMAEWGRKALQKHWMSALKCLQIGPTG